MLPPYLHHLNQQTDDSITKAREEMTVISSLSVSMRTLVTSCEPMARSFHVFIRPTLSVLLHLYMLFYIALSLLLLSWCSNATVLLLLLQELQRCAVAVGVGSNECNPFTGGHTAAAAATTTEPRQSLAVKEHSSDSRRRPVRRQVSCHCSSGLGCCQVSNEI